MHRMSLSSLLFKGPFEKFHVLKVDMSAEGLEDSSFQGMQVPSTQYEYPSYITSWSNAIGEFIRW
jgi:hypothetical protein